MPHTSFMGVITLCVDLFLVFRSVCFFWHISLIVILFALLDALLIHT